MNLQRAIHLSRKRRAAHKAEMAKIRRVQEQTDDEIAEAQRLANQLMARYRAKRDRSLAQESKLSDERFRQLLRAAVRALRRSRKLR